MHELGLKMLLILIWCWYCYAADTVILLILICCWYCYAADILILLCCWYTDTAGMYALNYMLNVPCLTSIYFTTVSRWNHAVAKSRPLKTKQIQHFIQYFENHSKHNFFIKSKQFQHDMFSNSKHSFIKHKQFQHDMFSTICII
jgi:hypothetical protein